jgi:hypothetical protein
MVPANNMIGLLFDPIAAHLVHGYPNCHYPEISYGRLAANAAGP